MAIVLLILKWIGIILLVLLALIVFLLLVALLCPVRYRVRLDYEETVEFQYRFRWTCFLVKVGKDGILRLYLFGIPIRRLSGDEPKKAKVSKQKTRASKEKAISSESKSEKRKSEIKTSEGASNKAKKSKTKNQKKPRKAKKRTWKEKLHFHFQRISSIMKFVKKKENKNVFFLFCREIKALLLYSSPRKIKGLVRFGTSDPSTTGLLLGGISLLPWIYRKDFQVIPDFTDKVLIAHLTAIGRIRVFYMVRLLWRLYRNKELKRTIKEWKQLTK